MNRFGAETPTGILGWLVRSALVVLLAVTGALEVACTQEPMAEEILFQDFAAERARIQILARSETADGISVAVKLGDVKFPDNDVLETTKRASFPQWLKYEDEYVTFYYPKSPHIRLEAPATTEAFTVVGGAMGTTENTFFRCYRLVIGDGVPYCTILLDRKDHFDDGTCFCGAVVYKKYLFRDGSLWRFSFLEDGQVKKIQVLRGGLRAVLFEWTHMAIHQDVYVKIGLGLTMKGQGSDEAAQSRQIMEKYGFGGRLGFLERGMSADQVEALLGQPAERRPDALVYEQVDGRHVTSFRIPLEGGVFCHLPPDYIISSKILPPEKGSLDWIEEKAEYGRVLNSARVYDLGPLTKEDAAYIFDRFIELAPAATSEEWRVLCGAVCDLSRKGYKDDRIPPILRKRYQEKNLDQKWTEYALCEYDPQGSQVLFIQRAQWLLEVFSAPKYAEEADPDYLTSPNTANFSPLLRFLDSSNPLYAEIILRCMDHPNDTIRKCGIEACGGLPLSQVLPRLIAGLSDRSVEVRAECAAQFWYYGASEHLPLLKARLAQEQDSGVREYLEQAIQRLSPDGPAGLPPQEGPGRP
ncbi:MAG: HEAT repeat domain-containing protein [Planctomycetota bacterium]|nr:HEAT repeat domain-containing protein [Planctomycetota bacterium]